MTAKGLGQLTVGVWAVLTLGPGVASPPAVAQPSAPGPVTFAAEDGASLAGRVFGQGANWVVLAHMPVTHDQRSWADFAELVGRDGLTALTFDFRGHGGSAGQRDLARLDRDVRAALKFALDRGARKVLLVGASLGGTAVLKVAAAADVTGVIAVAASPSGGGLSVSHAEVAAIKAPKLFIVGVLDRCAVCVQGARDWMRVATEPKELKEFGESAHGTDLFSSPSRQPFIDVMFAFIRKSLN